MTANSVEKQQQNEDELAGWWKDETRRLGSTLSWCVLFLNLYMILQSPILESCNICFLVELTYYWKLLFVAPHKIFDGKILVTSSQKAPWFDFVKNCHYFLCIQSKAKRRIKLLSTKFKMSYAHEGDKRQKVDPVGRRNNCRTWSRAWIQVRELNSTDSGFLFTTMEITGRRLMRLPPRIDISLKVTNLSVNQVDLMVKVSNRKVCEIHCSWLLFLQILGHKLHLKYANFEAVYL